VIACRVLNRHTRQACIRRALSVNDHAKGAQPESTPVRQTPHRDGLRSSRYAAATARLIDSAPLTGLGDYFEATGLRRRRTSPLNVVPAPSASGSQWNWPSDPKSDMRGVDLLRARLA